MRSFYLYDTHIYYWLQKSKLLCFTCQVLLCFSFNPTPFCMAGALESTQEGYNGLAKILCFLEEAWLCEFQLYLFLQQAPLTFLGDQVTEAGQVTESQFFRKKLLNDQFIPSQFSKCMGVADKASTIL